MKKFTLLAIVFCNSFIGFTQNWQMVWSDEFNYSGLPDSSKWEYEVGKVRNKEAQYYTKARLKNARVENGSLVLEAHKETYEDMDFTSASIHTRNTQEFLYGRIEARAKVPVGVGTWPAIWTLGINIHDAGWPLCGEIDILENVGFNPKTVHANIHTTAYNHALGTNKGDSAHIQNPANEFHNYAVEWTPDRIDFFLDSVNYFSFENDQLNKPETWPFNKPQYLILNLAVGGMWGGMKGIDSTLFPHKYYVDYVRYYKKDDTQSVLTK